MALLIVLLGAGYALGGLARLGLLPAGIVGSRPAAVEVLGGGALPPDRGERVGPGDTPPGTSRDPSPETPGEDSSGTSVGPPAAIPRASAGGPSVQAEPETPAGRLSTAVERPNPFHRGYLDLNAADSLDLLELPGVGPALAGRILALRRERSGFQSIAELRDVRGVGEKRFARLAELVCVKGDCRKQ